MRRGLIAAIGTECKKRDNLDDVLAKRPQTEGSDLRGFVSFHVKTDLHCQPNWIIRAIQEANLKMHL